MESRSQKPLTSISLIFLTFVIYYGIGNYWLLYYQLSLFLAITVVAAAVVTLYFGLYHWLTRKSRSASFKILCAFALWPLLPYLVRLTPVTTALFEAPFYGPLEFFQIASFIDYSFLGALLLAFSLAVVLYPRKRGLKSALWIMILSACLGGLYVWGHARLQAGAQPSPRPIKVALIQHNIPVSGEWRFDHPDEIRTRYQTLALKAAAAKPDLIIFPLYDFPDDPLRKPAFFESLAKETGAHILVASHIPEVPDQSIFEHGYRNVAVLYAPDGRMLGSYQSVEKAPGFSPVTEHNAAEYKVLDSPWGKLGILLCYEDSKPEFARQASRLGARLLIALSNPGFFSKTHMPWYHLIQDRLRAIETKLPLLRVSSNGYSAQIDPLGRFIQKSELEKEEILFAKV
jgi:apolipoprotein N-acyltransferase